MSNHTYVVHALDPQGWEIKRLVPFYYSMPNVSDIIVIDVVNEGTQFAELRTAVITKVLRLDTFNTVKKAHYLTTLREYLFVISAKSIAERFKSVDSDLKERRKAYSREEILKNVNEILKSKPQIEIARYLSEHIPEIKELLESGFLLEDEKVGI
jgi:hypothetical protein